MESPLLAVAAEFTVDADKLRPGDGAVVTRFSFADTVEDILGLLPETSRLVMVFGASELERRLAGLAKIELQPYSGRIGVEYTNDLALGTLQRRLAGLPEGSAVFYGLFNSDVNGLYLEDYSGLALVRAASSAPVFGPFDDLLGRGIVGGRLIQLDKIGREMASTAEDMLRKNSREQRWKVVGLSQPDYAWPELQACRQAAPCVSGHRPYGNSTLAGSSWQRSCSWRNPCWWALFCWSTGAASGPNARAST
jgi:hypothetical protein